MSVKFKTVILILVHANCQIQAINCVTALQKSKLLLILI